MLRAAIAGIALAGISTGASAQQFPAKPVTVQIAYAPGGVIDNTLRLIAPNVGSSLGQPLLLVNRPGASGTIATEAVIAAGPNGYTLLSNGDQLITSPHLMGNLVKYDVFRDLAPITRLFSVPFALLVHPSVPASTLKEFTAWAKSGKSKLTYATPGNGTGNHLAMEYFKSLTGAQILHVPYKGAAAAILDVTAGRVDSIMFSPHTTIASIKAGKLRAIALTGSSRHTALPDVPSFAEAGMPNFDMGTTFGLFAPAGTPDPIVRRLHAAFTGALRTPSISKQIEDHGSVVTADLPEEFAKKLRSDYERNGRIVRENAIRPE
jgi:tripartite-type tricarboxylate transporter receptor subunit TctC